MEKEEREKGEEEKEEEEEEEEEDIFIHYSHFYVHFDWLFFPSFIVFCFYFPAVKLFVTLF